MTRNRTRHHLDGDGSAPAPAMSRRVALGRMAALPLVAALPVGLAACNRGPKCDDTTGLSPEDAKVRTEVAAYVEKSPDITKYCSTCVQFTAGGSDACGTCKVVKGPINPEGTCKLYVAKPS
jgi:hypothetical protein